MIFESIISLFLIFTFSSGTVSFIKNVKEGDSLYLSIMLTLLIINLSFIIEQNNSFKKLYTDEK
nr:MAG TPA: hypothetical protein [Caudoviricetes sp.]